jgi:hypothetical protein
MADMPTLLSEKLAELPSVREYGEGAAVELWRNVNGRLVIRAYNDCRNNITDVDLLDILDWLRAGQGAGVVAHENAGASNRGYSR